MLIIVLLCLLFAGFMLVPTLGLYIWFRGVMWLLGRQHSIREKTGLVYYFFVFLGVLGLIGDCLYNFTFGTILFLQLPKDVTLSKRVERIRKTGVTGWRRKLADTVCGDILNPISNRYGMGDHC